MLWRLASSASDEGLSMPGQRGWEGVRAQIASCQKRDPDRQDEMGTWAREGGKG